MELKDIKTENKERDLEICESYLEGESASSIAGRVGLSVRRINAILYTHKECLKVDVDWEKTKRIHWLKSEIEKKQTSRKDKADLIEQLRKEIEGDKPQVNNEQHTHFNYTIGRTHDPVPASKLSDRDTGRPDTV